MAALYVNIVCKGCSLCSSFFWGGGGLAGWKIRAGEHPIFPPASRPSNTEKCVEKQGASRVFSHTLRCYVPVKNSI
jgi:hypothetical protein